MVGRSNSGKSTFINALAKKAVAKVSQTPGKTRLLNFFNVEGKYKIVDLPGYGFAARSKKEQNEWQGFINEYLMYRENLAGIVLIMDIRRDWDEREEQILEFANMRQIPVVVVLNKQDKLSNVQRLQKVRDLQKLRPQLDVFSISAHKKQGIDVVEEHIFSRWIQGARL